MSIRTLLEFNEQILRDNNFTDAWLSQKQSETDAAFLEFANRIEFIDGLEQFEDRWLELSKGIVAGNMFDWGARAVADILETSEFKFLDAMNTIQKRPWFKDDLDTWINKFKVQIMKFNILFLLYLL